MSQNGNSRKKAYKTILKDLLKEESVLKKVISNSLGEYRPIREEEVKKKSARKIREDILQIPPASIFFTDDYKEMKEVKKSAMKPFYVSPAMPDNEKLFLKPLEENKEVVWWYKNGDTGSEFFAIDYYNEDENKDRLFYPDWIVKTKNKIWIIDTKAGFTAESKDTKYKAEALQK